MNTKAMGETIEDIASSVANSKWAKSIIPTINELNQTMAKNISSSKKFLDKQAQLGATQALERIGGLSKEEAETISKSISSKNINESIDELKDEITEYISDNRDIDKIISGMKKKATDNINKEPNLEQIMDGMKKNEKYLHYPKAYFTNPDKTIRNTRIGTAIGAYAALSVGRRYLQGGTLTTDEYGRKDIAGIPFL